MRVAAFQRRPVLDQPRVVAATVAEDLAWATRAGVSLAVFPEAYLDGHSYDPLTISARARALDDPEVRHLAESLRHFPVTAVVGMFECRGGAVRNVALVLGAEIEKTVDGVRGAEYLGTTQIVTVITANGQLKARLPSDKAVRVGESVGLKLRPDRLSLFDATSGQVLASALEAGGRHG